MKEGLANSNHAFYQIKNLKFGADSGFKLQGGKPFLACALDRDKFKNLTKQVLDRMLLHVEKALTAARICPKDLTRLLISGEGTRLFALREELAEIPTLDGIALLNEYMPSYGAALQAALVSQTKKDLIIWDLLTRPIYMIADEQCTQVIAKNTPLPVTAYVKVPIKDNTVNIKLMQGFIGTDARNFDPKSKYLGATATFTDIVINNCPPSLEATELYGDKQVELAIRVSHDGIISYGARHLGLGVALLVSPLQDQPRDYNEGIERHLVTTRPTKELDDKQTIRLACKLNLPLYALGDALTALGFTPEQIASGEAIYLALHDLKSSKKKSKKHKA